LKLQSKPPLPENRKRFEAQEEETTNSMKSCREDPSILDDEQFYSACESFDMTSDGKNFYKIN